MSTRDQRVGTSHPDRVREDVSLEYVTLSQRFKSPYARVWCGSLGFSRNPSSK